MEQLRDMLCDKLDEITMAGDIKAGSLDTIDKLTHAIKSIDTIMAMEDAGYSNEGSYYDGSYNEGSYADDRGRGSYARRDSMGRYSRARNGRTNGRTNRGYSRDDKEHMVEKIEDMMEEAQDKEVKEALRKVLHVMK